MSLAFSFLGIIAALVPYLCVSVYRNQAPLFLPFFPWYSFHCSISLQRVIWTLFLTLSYFMLSMSYKCVSVTNLCRFFSRRHSHRKEFKIEEVARKLFYSFINFITLSYLLSSYIFSFLWEWKSRTKQVLFTFILLYIKPPICLQYEDYENRNYIIMEKSYDRLATTTTYVILQQI